MEAGRLNEDFRDLRTGQGWTTLGFYELLKTSKVGADGEDKVLPQLPRMLMAPGTVASPGPLAPHLPWPTRSTAAPRSGGVRPPPSTLALAPPPGCPPPPEC